jgi:fido (protein-threonine AMPylation protein)
MNTENQTNFCDILWSFSAGVASSSLVAFIIYKKQKRESEKFQRDITLTLVDLIKQGKNITVHIKEIEDSIKDGERTSRDKAKYLVNEFKKTNRSLKTRFANTKHKTYLDNVLKYKLIADELSTIIVPDLKVRTLDSRGNISKDQIINVHKLIFPEGYTWAGQLRTEIVKITSNANVSGRIIDPTLSSITIDVVEPDQIPDLLQKLITNWNTKVSLLHDYDLDSKCQEIAYFHQEFLLIHPFIDGNGRVAKIIADDQASFLFNRKIALNLDSDKEQYYRALRLADLKEIDALSKLIQQKIKNGNS